MYKHTMLHKKRLEGGLSAFMIWYGRVSCAHSAWPPCVTLPPAPACPRLSVLMLRVVREERRVWWCGEQRTMPGLGVPHPRVHVCVALSC